MELEIPPDWMRDAERLLTRLQRWIRKHALTAIPVGMDPEVAACFQSPLWEFASRKTELCNALERILAYLGEKRGGNGCALLVVESENWSRKELWHLVSVLKDYYPKVTVEWLAVVPFGEEFVQQAYAEWGVLLQEEETEKRETVWDFMLYLGKDAARYKKRFAYQKAYMVWEQEMHIKRIRRSGDKKAGYGGLCYACEGTEIPYRMAVDLYRQDLDLFHQLGISSVAIYELEWYNGTREGEILQHENGGKGFDLR